jgi:hypothetical protein
MKIFDGLIPVSTLFKSLLKNKIEKEEIFIQFDYPLETPAVMKFKDKNGFDLAKIIQCIIEGYVNIYKSEEKYGIWGHEINDLSIEAILYDEKKNLVTMSIGS